MGSEKGRQVGKAAINARKTHCIHGHPLSGDNLRITRRGRRDCKACARKQRNENAARYRALAREPSSALSGPAYLDNYIPVPESGCWLWLGGWGRDGYGKTAGTGYLAHRHSFEFHKGPVPPDLFVCHKCDTPACINPDHLFLGTPLDNTRDMLAKGRAYWQRKQPNDPTPTAARKEDGRG